MDVRVVSIGTLAQHPLWGEKQSVRSGHATTTVVVAKNRRILVDPGLPAQILVARLGERANLRPDDITDVFLTCFRPDVRRGIEAFGNAAWWVSAAERESVGVPLAQLLAKASGEQGTDPQVIEALGRDVAILKKCQPAPDRFAERVSLFPLAGVTPGMCGLVVEGVRFTTLIAGDAVPTVEHLEQGQVLAESADLEAARESFAEAIEIADLIVPGRDNILVNPTKKPF